MYKCLLNDLHLLIPGPHISIIWESISSFSLQKNFSFHQVDSYTADAEVKLEGCGPWSLGKDFELIHTPGHSTVSFMDYCIFFTFNVLFPKFHMKIYTLFLMWVEELAVWAFFWSCPYLKSELLDYSRSNYMVITKFVMKKVDGSEVTSPVVVISSPHWLTE